MSPLLIDFENYDGMVAPDKFGTAFGGATPHTGSAYAGPFAYGDESATPTLAILAGHPPGTWAVSETVKQASKWGMGGGIWMGCTDATGYKGVSFWVRGSSTRAVFSFGVAMEKTSMPDPMNSAGGGTCPGTKDTCISGKKVDIPLTMDWTEVRLMWADFTPGMSDTVAVPVNGDNITALEWGVPLAYQADPAQPDAGVYVAIPGDLLINIDDVSFIQ